MDYPEFLISANPGESPRPLRSIVSGGEMSRVMLAIKAVLAEIDEVRSLVFDEIDAGIGGQVAVAVGQHLSDLAACKQVLCVTHLATIAARADNHLRVTKRAEGDRTVTRVEPVTDDMRVEEIARMLSGDSGRPEALTHARQLLGGGAAKP
jgi:DNA repair protein RecN (Recombination protein N)